MRITAISRAILVVAAMSLSGCSTGCIAVGHGDSYTQPTLGRQLQELKVAHDTGAMSDSAGACVGSSTIRAMLCRPLGSCNDSQTHFL